MSWKGKAVTIFNRAIAPIGLAVGKVSIDYEARLTSTKHVLRVHKAMADVFSMWLEQQRTIVETASFEPIEHIERFYEAYLRSPFREQHGGSRYNNALWLSLVAKSINPSLIVDSGTYTGASAWALSFGAPRSKLFSFDIDLSHLKQKVDGCTYIQRDWTSTTWTGADTGLCYFDDHVDQAKRLIEARERGFRYAIFDDDFEIGAFAPMAHGSHALPKVEFVLDTALEHGEKLSWMSGASQYSWTVDRTYLDRARATIEHTERLPNTSLITGIHQTPYRLVRLKA